MGVPMTLWVIDRSDDRGKNWHPVKEMPAGDSGKAADAKAETWRRVDEAKRAGRAWSYRLSAYSTVSGDRSSIEYHHTPYLTSIERFEIDRFARELKAQAKPGVMIQDPDTLGTIEVMGRRYAALMFKFPKGKKRAVKDAYLDLVERLRAGIDRSIIPQFDVMVSGFPLLLGVDAIPQGLIVFFVGAPPPAQGETT
ncbi:MAG: hypothetical protein ISN29_04990 [Gammaproteobacteria bacterium AqS3]|nr:hypothetical protein [Gammaproteobacteria bacterium AqS3]